MLAPRPPTGSTTPSATPTSPRCAAPSRRRWPRYGADGRCLMRVASGAARRWLGGPVRGLRPLRGLHRARFADPPDPRLVELAGRHLRSRPIELEVKKMAPDAHGTMRKIAEDARIEPGWALARFGDGGWWPAIDAGCSDGDVRRGGRRGARRRRPRPGALGGVAVRGPERSARRHAGRARPAGGRRARRSHARRCWSAPSRARRSGRWPTRSARRRTSAARSG